MASFQRRMGKHDRIFLLFKGKLREVKLVRDRKRREWIFNGKPEPKQNRLQNDSPPG